MKEQSVSEPRVVKIAVCPSLSGRTDITYHIGCRDKDDVCFRIWGTSGKGVFSKEWVCASDIHKVLGQHKALNATTLLPVFKVGRSVNTTGFLLAVLKSEQLVAQSSEEAHKYVRVQSEQFVAEMDALIKSGVSLDPVADAPAAQKAGKRGRGKASAPPWDGTSQADTDAPAK
jgi:hypothetical protein